MGACSSCLKSICCCGKNDNDEDDYQPLIHPKCGFALGIHDNVTVEIAEGCKVVSMKPATKDDVYLCDPCPAGQDDDTDTADLYQQGYDTAKSIYTDIGYNNGYTAGMDDGKKVGKSEGYAKGYADGDEVGFARGEDYGRADTDCNEARREGYDQGLADGQDSNPEDVNSLLDSLNSSQAQEVTYVNSDGDQVTAIVRTNPQGIWATDNPSITVDPSTGAITVDADDVQAGTAVVVAPTTVSDSVVVITECAEPDEDAPEYVPPVTSADTINGEQALSIIYRDRENGQYVQSYIYRDGDNLQSNNPKIKITDENVVVVPPSIALDSEGFTIFSLDDSKIQIARGDERASFELIGDKWDANGDEIEGAGYTDTGTLTLTSSKVEPYYLNLVTGEPDEFVPPIFAVE